MIQVGTISLSRQLIGLSLIVNQILQHMQPTIMGEIKRHFRDKAGRYVFLVVLQELSSKINQVTC